MDYKRFMKVLEIDFGAIRTKNSKKADLKKMVSDLLTRALRYKPKERSMIKDVRKEIKKLEYFSFNWL